MISLISSTPILAASPSDYTCLTREEQEKIAVTFDENEACHADLAKLTQPEPASPSWEKYALIFVGGIAVGAFVQSHR